MRWIGVLQVFGAVTVLALAAVPVSGRTIYSHNDGSAEDAIYGENVGDAVAVQFYHSDPGHILGARVYVASGAGDQATGGSTTFAVHLTTQDETDAPEDDILVKQITTDARDAFSDYFSLRGVTASPFFVVVKYLVPREPEIGLDTDNAAGADSTWHFLSATEPWTNLSDLPEGTLGAGMIDVVAGKMGDLNGDDAIDTQDALYALECFAGIKTRTPEDVLVGDTNLDGTLDTVDALAFLDIFAGRNTVDDYFK